MEYIPVNQLKAYIRENLSDKEWLNYSGTQAFNFLLLSVNLFEMHGSFYGSYASKKDMIENGGKHRDSQ